MSQIHSTNNPGIGVSALEPKPGQGEGRGGWPLSKQAIAALSLAAGDFDLSFALLHPMSLLCFCTVLDPTTLVMSHRKELPGAHARSPFFFFLGKQFPETIWSSDLGFVPFVQSVEARGYGKDWAHGNQPVQLCDAPGERADAMCCLPLCRVAIVRWVAQTAKHPAAVEPQTHQVAAGMCGGSLSHKTKGG